MLIAWKENVNNVDIIDNVLKREGGKTNARR